MHARLNVCIFACKYLLYKLSEFNLFFIKCQIKIFSISIMCLYKTWTKTEIFLQWNLFLVKWQKFRYLSAFILWVKECAFSTINWLHRWNSPHLHGGKRRILKCGLYGQVEKRLSLWYLIPKRSRSCHQLSSDSLPRDSCPVIVAFCHFYVVETRSERLKGARYRVEASWLIYLMSGCIYIYI